MKKNLIFLTLLISVLMVSVVSASITGYLVSRGGGIADSGYTARLQKVEGTTAIISVATPSGTTEVVRVEEGQTAKVDGAEISASGLTRGTLFKRGGGEISIETNEEANPVAKIATSSGSLIGNCAWIDRYGTTAIDGQPINSVCPSGYNPIAYELNRHFFIYNDSACSNEISESSDHQLMQSYGANVPNFGEEAGNMNVCIKRFGINYGTIDQIYDGVLCC